MPTEYDYERECEFIDDDSGHIACLICGYCISCGHCKKYGCGKNSEDLNLDG